MNYSATKLTDNCLIPPVPKVRVPEDYRIYVAFKQEAATSDTIESEESDIKIPITVVRLSDGHRIPGWISLEDMTGFKPSGSVDITTGNADFTPLAYYSTPAGHEIFVGHEVFSHSFGYAYLGDDS
jgi:hypothetical protein